MVRKKKDKIPKVSVITCVYNESPKKLKITLDSVLNQSFKDFEYIIILDKPDNFEAEKLIEKYQIKEKRIIFIKNEKNLSYGLSKNPGVKIARGKYICICDAEHFYYEDKLKIQYNYLERNKNIDLLFTSYFGLCKNGKKIKKVINENSNFKNNFFNGPCFRFLTIMIKSEIFKENLYEKSVVPDDFYLYVKLYKKNYRFKVISNITMDICFTSQLENGPKYYLKRFLRDYFNYLKIFLLNYTLFYNCRGFHRNMLRHFFMLCVFIIFKICDIFGIFKPIIWERWLIKKWK